MRNPPRDKACRQTQLVVLAVRSLSRQMLAFICDRFYFGGMSWLIALLKIVSEGRW